MRKIRVSEFLSLDGVMEAPERWHFPFASEDMQAYNLERVLAPDVLVLGRVTYDIFASSWPKRTNNEYGMADKFNTMPKYVVSSTLAKADWNNTTVIKTNAIEEIAKLKQQPGGDISITGSATLVHALLQAGLIDELHLIVDPIIVGQGKRLFEAGSQPLNLKLIDSRTFSGGGVALTYQPNR
jgi:dihydrofolate reductase